MQTILGANGVIGRELSAVLPAYTPHIRQVSRSPRTVNVSDERHVADLLDASATAAAVDGSAVAYLTAGLTYSARVWEQQWPVVMRNVIDACRRAGSRLVFLDNVYAYGRVEGPMTETTPYNPCSRKGEVRARIATMLMDAVRRGELQAMIVRSADFYGPGATLSLTHATVTERLGRGRTPQWVGDPHAVHTFTYTRDVAWSLAALGNTPEAFGQVWHALTSPDDMTGAEFVRLACAYAQRPNRLQVAPRWMLRLMGLVVPVLRENMEMLYQFELPYRFDSSKIASAFDRHATDYATGIAATLAPVLAR